MTDEIGQPPQTEASLRNDLEALGVERGMLLLVHSSLSSIGWVLGGAPTVLGALSGAVGDRGTLAMPAATPSLADPATWANPPSLPEELVEELRDTLPVFDRETTPTELGAIPECFRTWPGTLRSDHPVESLCARGPLAEAITEEHPLAFSEGEGSPLAKLHDLDSWILLLGVGFNRCSALHFAESLVENRRVMRVRFPVLERGRRVWAEHPNVADDNGTHFPLIGERYLADGRARTGSIGLARGTLFSMRDLVDHGRRYFTAVL